MPLLASKCKEVKVGGKRRRACTVLENSENVSFYNVASVATFISSEATRFERSENRVRVTSILNGQVAFFLGTNQRTFEGIFSGGVHSLSNQGFPQYV